MIWRSGSQILAQLVQWAATFLVIRLLSPSDYGLFAMTQVVLVLLNMLNGYGLASGLIQQAHVTPRMVRQLFGMLILLNVGLATAQLMLAPFAAAYYRQPIVADMLRVQALLYLTTPFIALPYALLGRRMDFRYQARANIVASIASASAALGGATAGLGVWTLGVRAAGAVRGARRDDDMGRAVAGLAQLRLSRRGDDRALWQRHGARPAVLVRAEPGGRLHRRPRVQPASAGHLYDQPVPHPDLRLEIRAAAERGRLLRLFPHPA